MDHLAARPYAPADVMVAIFCGPNSLPITRLSLQIHAGLQTMPIEVITPARCEAALRQQHEGLVIRADESLPGHTEVSAFLSKHQARLKQRGRSTNWYLQQYLKLAQAWDKPSWVFIHDGDTVFSPALLEAIRHEPFLLTTKEDITLYSNAATAVGLPVHSQSFIANGGIFSPKVLRQLGARADAWFIDIMERTVLADDARGDFSEYQIMGALLAGSLPTKPLKLFRRFDLLAGTGEGAGALRKATRALSRYDAVAFEAAHHSSGIKKLAGHLAYRVGYSW